METVKKVAGIAASVFLWMIILMTALFTFTTLASRDTNNVSSFLGYTPMIVQTDSMAPTFKAGDMIFVKKCDTSKLKEGDIVTFHAIINNEYALNTHRINEIIDYGEARGYITKGDNNDVADSHAISDNDIVGKYVGKSAFLGGMIGFLSGKVGFLLVIVLPMLLFFVYQVYHLIMVSINLKKAIAAEEAAKKALDEESADAKLAQAQAALEEAKRLKEEAEAKLAQAQTADKEEQ